LDGCFEMFVEQTKQELFDFIRAVSHIVVGHKVLDEILLVGVLDQLGGFGVFGFDGKHGDFLFGILLL